MMPRDAPLFNALVGEWSETLLAPERHKLSGRIFVNAPARQNKRSPLIIRPLTAERMHAEI